MFNTHRLAIAGCSAPPPRVQPCSSSVIAVPRGHSVQSTHRQLKGQLSGLAGLHGVRHAGSTDLPAQCHDLAISMLCESDLPALAEHLLRLSPDDRHLRFQGKVGDAAIQDYARRINLHRDLVCGVFRGTRLLAACHVGVYLEEGHAVGEVGVSVDAGQRGTGLGRRLVQAAREAAAERGVRRLDFVFLRGNEGMLRLARALGATLSFEDGEWNARLPLPEAVSMPAMTERRSAASDIEVLSTNGDAARTVMLVHGAGGDPWQFRRHFLPYLHGRGHRVVALSLRHHGRSACKGSGRLAQHVADVLAVVRSVGAPQMLIGHSMGGLVVQHVAQHVPVQRLVLLAPIPHDGLAGDELARALGSLKTASARALLAAALEGYSPITPRPGRMSTRVIGGLRDRVVPQHAVQRSAAAYGTPSIMLDAGHVLMSGRAWRQAAEAAIGAS